MDNANAMLPTSLGVRMVIPVIKYAEMDFALLCLVTMATQPMVTDALQLAKLRLAIIVWKTKAKNHSANKHAAMVKDMSCNVTTIIQMITMDARGFAKFSLDGHAQIQADNLYASKYVVMEFE